MPDFHLADFLPYQLSVTSNAVSRAVATGTGYDSRHGLTAAEWRVLAVVTAAGAPTQAELLTATGMDKMTISRAVSALGARGLLDQVRDTRDRRTRRLSATRAGRDIHDDVAPRALEVEAYLLAALTVPEAMALRTALARLREACLKP